MQKRGLYISPTEFVAFAEPGRQQRLSDHIATRDRSPDFTALGLYLPNPDPVLKKQGRDIAVYTDLRSDAHVGGCIRRRKAAVQAMEWRVERAGASAAMAKLAESVLLRLDMRRLVHEMTEAVLYGWQPLEVIWSPPGAGTVVPQDVLAKPVPWFHYDAEAQLRFKSREQPLYGEAVAARKFLVPTQEASYANPYGFADLSMCFWPTVFKRGGLKFWVTFTEKFGTPWVVGKTPRGTPGPEQESLLDQLESMVQDAVAVIPDDASVDIKEAGAKGATADLYERLLMFCRSEVSIALLGQNQSTEASSTYASATAGLEVAKDLRDGDARLVEAAVNQLLRWIVDLNQGEAAPAPMFELFEQKEVDDVRAKRDKTLSDSGVKFTASYWRRAYDLEEGDIAPDAAPGNGPGAAEVAVFAEATPADRPADQDALDAAISGIAPDLLQGQMADMLAPLRELLTRADTDPQAVLGWLAERFPDADGGTLQEHLARLIFASQVWGRLNGQA